MSETIGFLGLGALGLPVAENLIGAGHRLAVYNRTAGKADGLVAKGATLAPRRSEAATSGGVVISLLWDDASVEAVATSPGFLEALGPGGVHVSMSTITPAASRRLARLHTAHGCDFVEAPVFGRPDAARARQLRILLAGPAEARARVRPLLTDMGGGDIFDFGETIGAATSVKLAGNFLIISAASGLEEALRLVTASGGDAGAAVGMLTTTLFASPIYQTYGRMLAQGSVQPDRTGIPLKDLDLFARAAADGATAAPIAEMLAELRRRA